MRPFRGCPVPPADDHDHRRSTRERRGARTERLHIRGGDRQGFGDCLGFAGVPRGVLDRGGRVGPRRGAEESGGLAVAVALEGAGDLGSKAIGLGGIQHHDAQRAGVYAARAVLDSVGGGGRGGGRVARRRVAAFGEHRGDQERKQRDRDEHAEYRGDDPTRRAFAAVDRGSALTLAAAARGGRLRRERGARAVGGSRSARPRLKGGFRSGRRRRERRLARLCGRRESGLRLARIASHRRGRGGSDGRGRWRCAGSRHHGRWGTRGHRRIRGARGGGNAHRGGDGRLPGDLGLGRRRGRKRRGIRHRGDRELAGKRQPRHGGAGAGRHDRHRPRRGCRNGARDGRRCHGRPLSRSRHGRLRSLSLALSHLACAHRDRALLAGELREPVGGFGSPLPQPLHLARVSEEQQCQHHHPEQRGGGDDHAEL